MNNRPADSQIVEPLHREPRDLELSWRQAAPANRRAIARSAHMPHIANSFVERHLRAFLPLSRRGSIAHRRVNAPLVAQGMARRVAGAQHARRLGRPS